jgi:hypothetical protein
VTTGAPRGSGPYASGQPTSRLGVAVLVIAYIAIWTVTGRYWGLQHDAQLYAVQALAKIQPEIFSGDLFLRFRSQDNFTLFPYLCAWTIEWLDVHHAAALLTLVSFVGWMLVSWRLARALVGPQLALLGTGFLLVVPGWYGAGLVFRTAEPFLNARTPTEVFCLAAFLAYVRGYRLVAGALLSLAAIFHPIMAFPPALILLCLSMPWREARYFWPLAAAMCCVGAIAGAFLLGGHPVFVAGDWLRMTTARCDYLFPQLWLPRDWQTNALPLLTVLFASQLLNGWSKRLANATFWIAACGLVLASLAGTILPLKLILQGQPWRWMWVASALGIMLLPSTVAAAWRHSPAGRVVALLLCAAWLLAQWSSTEEVPPIGVAGLLLLCSQAIWLLRDRLSNPIVRVMTAGAAAALGLSLLGLAMSVSAILKGRFDFGGDPLWVQTTADVLYLPGAAMCAVTAVWFMTIRSWTQSRIAAVGIVAAALGVASAPAAAAAWMDVTYSKSAYTAFSAWRGRIPQDAEVLWPDGLQETWFLLNRRSYLTNSQMAGIIFSDELARESWRRAEILEPLMPARYWLRNPSGRKQTASLSVDLLARICIEGGPDFVVGGKDLGLDPVKVEWPTRAMYRYLYDCREIRSLRGPAAAR